MIDKSLEMIKTQGAAAALREHIDNLLFQLTNRNWSDIRDRNGFSRLQMAINDAHQILVDMEAALAELQNMNETDK